MTTWELWTVPRLPAAMDSLWAACDNLTTRPQPAHTRLGQVCDLTTDAWITALLDNAVIHTDHSENDDEIFSMKKRKEERGKADLTAGIIPGTNKMSASHIEDGDRYHRGDRFRWMW
jgi:hypothetical protein